MNVLSEALNIVFSRSIIAAIFIPGLVTALLFIILIIWVERKIAARVQMRIGPLYVTKRFGGILQLIADMLRFLVSEPVIPSTTDRLIYILIPILLLLLALLPIAVVPASWSLVVIKTKLSLLAFVALTAISPMVIMIAGWASNNKFSYIGGLREGFMLLSYEIYLFVSLLAMTILYGEIDFLEIVSSQKVYWGVILNPLAAVSFFIAMLASTSRFPFEIPDAESEIVMGPFTEYNSIMYGLVMGANYLRLYSLSLAFSDIFLGGWLLPFNAPLPNFTITMFKTFIVMTIAVFMRAVYPRYRVDQALVIGWEKLFPLAIISVLLSVILRYLGVAL